MPQKLSTSEGGRAGQVKEWILSHLTYVIFTLITIFFLIFSPNFATVEAAGSILQITALVTIMAVGATFVIVCGEIDLAVGSLASFSGMIAAILMDRGVPSALAVVLVCLLGAFIGMVNGLLVTRAKIPSFLVTLGMLSVLSGLALTVTNTMPVPIVDDRFNLIFWNGQLVGVPASVIWTLIVAVIGFALLHLSLFGRRVFATGGSAVAAEFSGVRTGRIKVWSFTLSSLTATLAGLMLAARSSGGNPSLGQGLELDVIAAVIIGGTSLFGGYGSVVGSVIGAIFIGIVQFGLLTMGYSTSIQEVIKGAIIVVAVSLNRR
jgi:ribose/xylose/arabinose/galactoside ABC-type transport system permease subunit